MPRKRKFIKKKTGKTFNYARGMPCIFSSFHFSVLSVQTESEDDDKMKTRVVCNSRSTPIKVS